MGSLTKETILLWGAFGGLLVIFWSFTYWRAAVKTALIAALFEGAIRKWGLPSGQELVYFLKDILLVGAYCRFFLFPDPAIRAVKVRGPATLMMIVAAIVSLSALNPNIGSAIVAAMGMKIYFLYIPLAFMMPYLFKDERDLARQLSWFILLAIPICALGFLQFRSPYFSVLNVYAHSTDELAGVATFGSDTRARITGTFSYISGMATFLVLFTGLSLALLVSQQAKFRKTILFVILPMLAANGLMSGSRSAVFAQLIMVGAYFLVSPFFGASGKRSNVVTAVAVVGILGISFSLFFLDARKAYEERTGGEEQKKEMAWRILWPITSVGMAFDDGGFFGYGIGLTHPASSAIRDALHIRRPKKTPPFFEAETGQIATELGLIGFIAWYFMRFYLLFATWTAFRNCPKGFYKALIFIFLLYSGIEMHVQFIYNHTAQFYFWAFYGITFIPFMERLTFRRRDSPNRADRSQQPVALS
ncbi:hypothetical protein BH11VER1_BH11VER1_10720 [soil metagenome]